MSAAAPSRQGQFTLSAPPPVRALAIAAGLAVVGALVLVLSEVFGWPVGFAVLGVVLLVLGVVLGVAALVLTARVRTVVRTDDDQITAQRAGRTSTARWAGVAEVKVVGQRLTLRDKQGGSAMTLLNPGHARTPAFLALLTEIQHRLDSSRGYTDLG